MKLTPLADRVILKMVEVEETTKGVKYLRDLSPVWKELLSGERKFTF